VTWQAHRVKTLRVGKWSSRRDDRPRSVSGTAARTQHATPTPLVDRPTAPRHLPTPPCPPLHCSPLVAGRSSAGPSSAGPSSPRPRRDPGDPLWPGREGIQRQNELDESTRDGDGVAAFPGGLHYADDTARIFLQGSTQYDALGHVWYDGNSGTATTPAPPSAPWRKPPSSRSRRRASSDAPAPPTTLNHPQRRRPTQGRQRHRSARQPRGDPLMGVYDEKPWPAR